MHLLRRSVRSYLGECENEVFPELLLVPHDSLLRRPRLLLRKIIQLPAQISTLRRSFRAKYHDLNDGRNAFKFLSIPPMELRLLLATARAWGVTLNDLFLALLLKCLSPLTTERMRARKRRLLSIGCVVNTRRDLNIDGSRTFGLFLGSFVVSHEVPEGMSLIEIAKAVQRQTSQFKRTKLYLGAALEMTVARWLLSFFSTERRKKLYQKNYPLWGGITNMNLNFLWAQPEGKPAVDYFRAVSTGPVTPLVLSITTVGNKANIGLTYRTTVFSAAAIDSLKSDFFKLIQGLPSSP